jgi:hypothetical protein
MSGYLWCKVIWRSVSWQSPAVSNKHQPIRWLFDETNLRRHWSRAADKVITGISTLLWSLLLSDLDAWPRTSGIKHNIPIEKLTKQKGASRLISSVVLIPRQESTRAYRANAFHTVHMRWSLSSISTYRASVTFLVSQVSESTQEGAMNG